MKGFLGVSDFLEELSHLSCFPLFLCIDNLERLSNLSLLFFGTLHSNGYIFLLCLSLLIFSQLSVSPPQTTIFPFCISFSWGWFGSLPPLQCYEPSSIILQVIYLSDLIPLINFSLPLYNHKGLDVGHIWMASVYPTLFKFKSQFCNNNAKLCVSGGQGKVRCCKEQQGSLHKNLEC